jgi:hypothetical protein
LKVEFKVDNTVQIIGGNNIEIEVEIWLIDLVVQRVHWSKLVLGGYLKNT